MLKVESEIQIFIMGRRSMVKELLLLIPIFLCSIVIGCKQNVEISKAETDFKQPIEYSSSEHAMKKTEYTLMIANPDYTLSLYEPKEGCYTGAYVLSNKKIQFNMEQFDEMTEKEHSIYIYNLRLGESFPVEWVLECISHLKTPHIILHPPNDELPYQDFLLDRTAKEFGEFYTPMFVQFYPNPQQYKGNPEEYKQFFSKAKAAFNTYASNTAFVWSIDSKSVYDSSIFYPGDEVVDWIGLNLYMPIYENGEKIKRNQWSSIDFFYYMYQHRKPLMLSQLAVSHYSNQDHGYYIQQAVDTITELYTIVPIRYPRIKAVHYMDFNNIEVAPNQKGNDNFSITDHSILLNMYRNLIHHTHYLDMVEIGETGSRDEEWFVSAYDVYEKDKQFFICKQMLEYEWKIPIPPEWELFQINSRGEVYYPLEKISSYLKFSIKIDENQKIIQIKK